LGRGLDSLLPAARERDEQPVEVSALREVAVDSVEPNPRQPRQMFDEATISDLSASITELGVLQPLLVREVGSGYELIAGERRLRAAREAKLETVPVLVVDTDEAGSLERALVENVHREDLDPLEEAAAYRQLLDETGMRQDHMAERLGKSPQALSNSLRLLELPTSIQRMVHERRITEGHARALLGLQGHPLQERAAQSVVADGMSVRATEALVRRYRERFEAPERSVSQKPPPTAVALEAERRLGERLQTKVKVEVSKRRRRIIIDATSDEDLARVTAVLMGEEQGGRATVVSPSD
jgi:ParB family chromosome partitioning protein